MEHTFEELKKKNVGELRDVAKGIDHEAVKGASQMNKEHLLEHICKALNIDMHVHHHVEGLDKTPIKKKMKELKRKRDEAKANHDHAALKDILRRMHTYKRKIKKATV